MGSFGKAGCLSFFPSKNLGCLGDGGMIVTNDPQVFERAEILRRHGGKVKYRHSELGMNSRLDVLQAAILQVKLPHLPGWNASRRRAAYRYNHLLANVRAVQRPQELATAGYLIHEQISESSRTCCETVYHQYTVRFQQRNLVQAALP